MNYSYKGIHLKGLIIQTSVLQGYLLRKFLSHISETFKRVLEPWDPGTQASPYPSTSFCCTVHNRYDVSLLVLGKATKMAEKGFEKSGSRPQLHANWFH